LVPGEATIKSEGKIAGQNMRLRFLFVIALYIIHPKSDDSAHNSLCSEMSHPTALFPTSQ
jgi:hypothetical protein